MSSEDSQHSNLCIWQCSTIYTLPSVSAALASRERQPAARHGKEGDAQHGLGWHLRSVAVAQAVLWSCRYQDGAAAVLGVDDLDVHQAGAQAQVLQVIADDRGEVLVICAVAVSVEVGAVLAAHAI